MVAAARHGLGTRSRAGGKTGRWSEAAEASSGSTSGQVRTGLGWMDARLLQRAVARINARADGTGKQLARTDTLLGNGIHHERLHTATHAPHVQLALRRLGHGAPTYVRRSATPQGAGRSTGMALRRGLWREPGGSMAEAWRRPGGGLAEGLAGKTTTYTTPTTHAPSTAHYDVLPSGMQFAHLAARCKRLQRPTMWVGGAAVGCGHWTNGPGTLHHGARQGALPIMPDDILMQINTQNPRLHRRLEECS